MTHLREAGPDKVTSMAGMPVMLWLAQGALRAECGTVEIEVIKSGEKYRGPIGGRNSRDDFFGYSGMEWNEEPTADEFEAYVMRVLELLSRDGRL